MRHSALHLKLKPEADVLPFKARGGDPGAIRTRDPQIRNLMLYPAELRGLRDAGVSRRRQVAAPGNLGQLPSRRNRRMKQRRSDGQFGALRLHPIWPKYLYLRFKVDFGCMHHSATRIDCCLRRLPDFQNEGGA